MFETLHVLLKVLNYNTLANSALKDKLTSFDSWQSVVYKTIEFCLKP